MTGTGVVPSDVRAPYTRRALFALVLMGSVACARAVTPNASPVGPHRPEPVAPLMMPVAEAMPPSTPQLLQGIMDSVLAAPMWRNARWGVLLVDAERGDTILSHDADRLFMPASNQKLLTAAIALQVLGPDYRWQTPVLLHGRQRGSTWNGDIQVVGSGDPSFSDSLRNGDAASAFEPVVAALAARGIRRINGRVVATGDAFPGLTTGFGWAFDDFDFAYSAAVDELLYNEGVLTLWVKGGSRAGASTTVRRAPTSSYPPLQNRVLTRVAHDTGAAPEALYDSTGNTLVLTGTVAVGDSARLTVAYRHPADAFTAALQETLSRRGLRITERRLAVRDTARRTADTAAILSSAAMRDVLRRMQKPSQNQIAELLFRTTGLVGSGHGSADSARAVGARTLATWGITNADAAYRDGSGLSRHDYLTPRAVVRVLDAMRLSPWFTMYRTALPLAGVDGTIANRMKGTPAAGNVHAKTGTLDKARSLSGYATSADGRLVLFSLLCNNYTVPTREVERVQDLLVTTLAASALPRRDTTGSTRPRGAR